MSNDRTEALRGEAISMLRDIQRSRAYAEVLDAIYERRITEHTFDHIKDQIEAWERLREAVTVMGSGR